MEKVTVTKLARLNFSHPHALKHYNKVMLSQFTSQYYILDPSRQDEDTERDFAMIVWVQMEQDCTNDRMADEMAHKLSDFGDFNVFKDSQNSLYLEFYHIEPAVVPS